ncbi:Cytochrome b5 [Astathelohania contejeani]|uniref:Cytochrome b5 n=1 Tax=Astathelohania contejeani TaxID=164912 RepID=A0ABQ7HY33_9MICR|nr:Cytochrome b5 [Thelohania contejeani]
MKITWEEIKKNKYIVINKKVYDIQEFLDKHPGGSEVLIENLGTDATEIFEAIGHSPKAREEMEKYYIGELCENPEEKSIPYRSTVIDNKQRESKLKYIIGVFVFPFLLAFTILYFK